MKINYISNSDEMKRYSVGGDYDRPIPRRIVEEMGVHRDEFGQSKKGAGYSYHFDTIERLKKKMSAYSYHSLLEYRNNVLNQSVYEALKNNLSFLIHEYPNYYNWLMSKLKIRSKISTKNTGMRSSPVAELLILWGMSVMVARYKKQLRIK